MDENKDFFGEEKPEESKKEPETKQVTTTAPVSDELQGLRSEVAGIKRDAELTNFLNTEAGKFYRGKEEDIRKLLADKATSSIKVEAVAKMVLDPVELAKQAIEEDKKSRELAKSSSIGGSPSPVSNTPETIDVVNMPNADFRKLYDQVKINGFKGIPGIN